MSTTTTPNGTSSNHTTRRGFALPCLRCEEHRGVMVALDNVNGVEDGDPAFRCAHCEAEWSGAEVRKLVGAWAKALAWLDTAPVLDIDAE